MVQGVCLHVFSVRIANASNLAADNKVEIASSGGIETIVAAMKQHDSNAAVQEQACGTLWNLAETGAMGRLCCPSSWAVLTFL
jgi:hypothetical protein